MAHVTPNSTNVMNDHRAMAKALHAMMHLHRRVHKVVELHICSISHIPHQEMLKAALVTASISSTPGSRSAIKS